MPQPSPDPIRWPLEAVWQAVEPTLAGFTCEMLPTVDSTNAELMRRFKKGQTAPCLLVAEHQSQGRGRMGRQWAGTRGASLMFSLGILLSPAAWSGLSLAVGVSLAESLDPARRDVAHIGLKWPNDLWLAGSSVAEQKLGGVLIETATWEDTRYVVVGVGLNIASVTLPGGSSAAVPPGQLRSLLPELDAAGALLRVVPPLVQAVQAFSDYGFSPFQARFARRDVLANREVVLPDGATGKAHGVSEEGALLVLTANGMQAVASAEVSIRPVTKPAAAGVTPGARAI
jgi:BirA family transcriptional regulator, biotin operon repressor / biotin---[acetyl-CoA-carboxylase] ligase